MPKLLIIENDSFAGNFLARNLESQGFSVVEVAPSASYAMKLFRENKPNCVLIDIELGNGPNGIDLARAFRKINPTVGVVFLTSIVNPKLIDLKGLELPDSSIYLAKSNLNIVTDIAESVHYSIELGKSKKPGCIIKQSDEELKLTAGQYELIRLVADGLSNKEIARIKFVTVKSAENAIARLAKKLEIADLNTISQRVMITKKYYQLLGKY